MKHTLPKFPIISQQYTEQKALEVAERYGVCFSVCDNHYEVSGIEVNISLFFQGLKAVLNPSKTVELQDLPESLSTVNQLQSIINNRC